MRRFATLRLWSGKLLWVSLLSVFLASQATVSVVAITCPSGWSQIDCDAINYGYVTWVPDPPGCSSDLGGTVSLSGNDSLQKIFNYFVTSRGYRPEWAAGIVGNISVESGGEPRKLQGNPPTLVDMPPPNLLHDPNIGWGIVQWTPPDKIVNYAQAVAQPANELPTQLDFLWKQLEGTAPNNNEKAAGDQLKAVTQTHTGADGARAAAVSFLQYYERAADSSPGSKNAVIRGNLAVQALDMYGPKAAPASTPADTPAASCGGGGTGVSAGAGFLGDPGKAVIGAIDSYQGNAQCVGYVEYELGQHFPPYKKYAPLGNGIDVASGLGKNYGVAVNKTPAVHAVFSMPIPNTDTGHTGMVSGVTLNSDGSLKSITVEDYNYSAPGTYGTRTWTASDVSGLDMTFAHTEVKWQ